MQTRKQQKNKAFAFIKPWHRDYEDAAAQSRSLHVDVR